MSPRRSLRCASTSGGRGLAPLAALAILHVLHIADARAQPPAPSRPNIVHIFADDLGWGSVGFNGQELIETPSLDALAAAGMRFDNSYACTVCAPSRAMLYTGFHQGHAKVDRNGAIGGGFRDEDVMTAEVLAPADYTSAVFGKWGFGASGTRTLGMAADPLPTITSPTSLPNNHGVSEFYGYLNHSAAHDYFYSWMWQTDANAPNGLTAVPNNGGPGGAPQYTHDLIAERSEQFLAQHVGGDQPFYLQVNYTIPHSDLDAIDEAPGGYGPYAARPWTNKQKAYAAMITRMDASIGALLDQLDDPNNDGDTSDSVLADTLIMFSSDNGPTPEDSSPMNFFDANRQYRGGKRDLYEGGIHVPGLAVWPGVVPAGSQSDYRTDLADFMATAAELAGVETPVGIDGVSLVPTLTGAGQQRERPYLVFEHHENSGPDADPRTARSAIIRQDGMKLIRYSDGSSDLFNLNLDPDETSPLNLALVAHAQLAAQLEAEALAEGVQQSFVEFRTWSGPERGNLAASANWSGGSGAPNNNWSAVVANVDVSPRTAVATTNIATLGLEVRGDAALQTIDVGPGAELFGRNEVRISAGGRIALADARLESNRWVNIRTGGQLTGAGDVAGDVYNAGTIAPGRPADLPPVEGGAPVGTLALEGDLYHLAGATLAIDIGGADQAQFDRLAVAGAVELEGPLTVDLPNLGGGAYAPALNDEFTILTAASLSGTFSSVELPTLPGDLTWHVDYAPQAVTLRVLASADFDRDGDVDSADLGAWKQSFGSPSPAQADGDHDGDADGADLVHWQRQLGRTSSETPASHVPEPALAPLTLALVLAAVRKKAAFRTRKS
ncbi:MAG TPA: sulfatase-like hydrolase/transferase [Lacipirellula sp.]